MKQILEMLISSGCIYRLLGVDDQAWDGLKETAGSSSQVRHHVGAVIFLTFQLSLAN